jgi:type I restriction enzyme S subunit
MKWEKVELKSIVKKMHQGINTVTDKIIYTEIGYPIIQSKHITKGFLDLDTARFVSKETFDRYKGKYNPKKGNILFCNIGSIGQNLAIYENADFVIAWNLFLIELNEEKVFPKFLSHYLFYLKGFSFYDRFLTGGTIKFINKKKMSSLTILLPPLPIQQQIADLLDTADALRRTTAEQLQQLDDLAESVFLEMFGDVVRNEKGWEKKIMKELAHENCPLTYGIVQPGEEVTNGIPIVRPVDLTQDFIEKNHLKRVDEKIANKFIRTKLSGNEILISVRGSIGGIGYATSELTGANVTRGIVPLWFKNDLLINKYFFYLYKNRTFQKYLKTITKGATLIQLNIKDLRSLKIPVPPIKLQNEFTKIIENIEVQKVELKQSLQDSEDLFKGLLQEIFN